MKIIYDTDTATVEVIITEGPRAYQWTKAGTYASAHDPIRGRVGALLLHQPKGKTVYETVKERAVELSLRRMPFYESLRLDSYVTLDLGEDGTVRAIAIEE